MYHSLKSGDACLIKSSQGSEGPAFVHKAAEEVKKPTTVQISKPLMDLYRLMDGDTVSIVASSVSVKLARTVKVQEVIQPAYSKVLSLKNATRPHWEWLLLKHVIHKVEVICPGQLISDVAVPGEMRSFKVLEVEGSSEPGLYRADEVTKLSIDVPTSIGEKSLLTLSSEGIGGLRHQVRDINKVLLHFSDVSRRFVSPASIPRRGGRLILHGPPGTGKTFMLNKIADAGWPKVFRFDPPFAAEAVPSLQKFFDEARRHEPSIILIDGIEKYAGRPNNIAQSSNFVRSIILEFEKLGDARVLVVASTTNLEDLDTTLRGRTGFIREIEIPIPDSQARTEILKISSGHPKGKHVAHLERIGHRTHGFVGADLKTLLEVAVTEAVHRHCAGQAEKADEVTQEGPTVTVEADETDLDSVLAKLRPSAMHEIFVETPDVRWTDIGGYDKLKESLKEAIEWPLMVSISRTLELIGQCYTVSFKDRTHRPTSQQWVASLWAARVRQDDDCKGACDRV